MEKRNLLVLFGILIIMSLSLTSAQYYISSQGNDVKNSTDSLINGNLTIEIWDSMTSGNMLVQQNFTNAIIEGDWNVVIDSLDLNDLVRGNNYYFDYEINGEDFDYDGDERLVYTSWVGDNVNFTGLIYGNASQMTGITPTESDPYWTGNYSAYNDSWSSTYNSTYDAYNSTGLIKNWNESGYLRDWNSLGYIKDWNATGYIKDWSTESGNSSWNESWADTLYISDSDESNLNVNSSTYWNNADSLNSTHFEVTNGALTIVHSFLTSLFDTLFSAKTTDDLTEGSSNLYDNQSFNEADLLTAHNVDWISTYNSTYDAYNSTGLIKNWNESGYLRDENGTGLIRDWNSLGYIKDWNATGYIKDWSTESGNSSWNESWADTLYIATSDLPLANKTTPYCGNITGAVSDLCTLTSAGADFSDVAFTNISETFEANITQSGGSLIITNPNNYNAIDIDQNGDTGDDPSTGGAINIDNTDNNGSAFVIYTNQGTDRQDALMLIKVDNSDWDGPILRIISDSADSEGTIRLDSPNPEIEFVDTDEGSGNDGKFEIRNHQNRMQINSRAESDSTFEKLWSISQLADGGNVQLASPTRDIGRFFEELHSRFAIFGKSADTVNYFSISTNTTPLNTADKDGWPLGDIFLVDGDGDVGMGVVNNTVDYDLVINSTTGSDILLQTTGSGDPSIILNTTNSLNKVTIWLDESETNNHLIFDGASDGYAIDTYLDIKATDGENAYINVYSGSNKGELSYSSGDIFRMIQQKQDGDIRLQVDDGGVTTDLVSLDGSTSSVGIMDTSPSYTLEVNGTLGVQDEVDLNNNNITNVNYIQLCNSQAYCRNIYINESNYTLIEEVP